jgi:hypothetical protein
MFTPNHRRLAATLSACALIAALTGCASTGATKTIGTLAGSSAGSVASKAMSIGGPWGYAASIVTSALGGFAGGTVTKLFGGGGGNEAQLVALARVLNAPEVTSLADWGVQDGKGEGGYAASTGPRFLSSTGSACRSFMLVAYRKGGFDLGAIKKGAGAVGDVKSSTEKLSDVNSVDDAVSGAKNAAQAVDKVQDTVAALSPGQSAAEPAAQMRPPGDESFGTACLNKDASGWVIVKTRS